MEDTVENKVTFEDYGHENGIRYWWASDFCNMLGYANMASFMNAINKAIKACMTANVDFYEDFQREDRIVNGTKIDDFKLSRFACYMVAMNADPKKPAVAKAQVYFADQVEKINILLEGGVEMERLHIREEIKIGNIGLNSIAKKSGVTNFGLFQDAGYRGLYNRSIKEVKTMKGIKQSADHFEYMGRTELAANLFRLTLTEEKLRNLPNIGERPAMNIHQQVGKEVRDMVIKNTGTTPEKLPTERKLSDVKKGLKKAKALNKQDQKKIN